MSKQKFCLCKSLKSNIIFILSVATIMLFGFAVILPVVSEKTFAEGDDPEDGISITVSDSVAAKLILFDEGDYKIAKDTVSVSSSAPYGYELFLSTDSEEHQSIYLNNDPTSTSVISPVAGTIAEPAVLTSNTWGFAIAGQGNFDNEYSTTSPDQNSHFAIIPTAANQQAVFENTSATASDNIDFYYGIKIELTLDPGEYKTSATYTAIAKEPPLTAKAILGENGNLNFLCDRVVYNVGDTYTDNIGDTTITNIYEVALNGISEEVRPWAAQSNVITTANFDGSFVNATPTSLTKWFRELRNLKSVTNAERNINAQQITDMSYMFDHAGYDVVLDSSTETLAIGTSLVTPRLEDVSYMFAYAGYSASRVRVYTSNLYDAPIKNLSHMFDHAGYSAQSFNSTFDYQYGWLAPGVDMSYMFAYAGYSHRMGGEVWINLPTYAKPSNVSHMFDHAFYNQYGSAIRVRNLNTWRADAITDMSYMFSYAFYSNNYPFEIEMFNGSGITTSLSHMFDHAGYNAGTFSLTNFTNWSTPRSTDTSYMFSYAGYRSSSFVIDGISSLNTSAVTDMSYMFDNAGYYATQWNIGLIENWNVRRVTNHEGFISLNRSGSNSSVVNRQPRWLD